MNSVGDYDRFRFVLSKTLPETRMLGEVVFSLEWRIGDEGFGKDSFGTTLALPFKFDRYTVPLFLRCHTGPMSRLSMYQRDQDYCGIGLRFY